MDPNQNPFRTPSSNNNNSSSSDSWGRPTTASSVQSGSRRRKKVFIHRPESANSSTTYVLGSTDDEDDSFFDTLLVNEGNREGLSDVMKPHFINSGSDEDDDDEIQEVSQVSLVSSSLHEEGGGSGSVEVLNLKMVGMSSSSSSSLGPSNVLHWLSSNQDYFSSGNGSLMEEMVDASLGSWDGQGRKEQPTTNQTIKSPVSTTPTKSPNSRSRIPQRMSRTPSPSTSNPKLLRNRTAVIHPNKPEQNKLSPKSSTDVL